MPDHRLLRTALIAALALLPACGGQAAPAVSPSPAAPPAAPRPANAMPAMQLSGQRVLVLPMQSVSGVGQGRAEVTREVMFALRERDAGTHWIDPDQLRAALRRSPGFAEDPDVLPNDAFRHHRERYVVEPLGGLLRRYGALMDARVVLILQSAQWLPAQGDSGVVRLGATMVDSRSTNVVWYGEADGNRSASADAGALATAAAALAARMVVATSR